jgi:hypothetical protein
VPGGSKSGSPYLIGFTTHACPKIPLPPFEKETVSQRHPEAQPKDLVLWNLSISRDSSLSFRMTLLRFRVITTQSPFEKKGNRKSPFVKGDLEGFSSAQHYFDETLTGWVSCCRSGRTHKGKQFDIEVKIAYVFSRRQVKALT